MRIPVVRWRPTRVALAVALIAALLPGSPAAALPSGSGWSGSWHYYYPTASSTRPRCRE
jgi:hypothetical protein